MTAVPPALPGTAQNKRLKESHELTRLLLGKADSHNNEDLARRVRRARTDARRLRCARVGGCGLDDRELVLILVLVLVGAH